MVDAGIIATCDVATLCNTKAFLVAKRDGTSCRLVDDWREVNCITQLIAERKWSWLCSKWSSWPTSLCSEFMWPVLSLVILRREGRRLPYWKGRRLSRWQGILEIKWQRQSAEAGGSASQARASTNANLKYCYDDSIRLKLMRQLRPENVAVDSKGPFSTFLSGQYGRFQN